MSSVASSPLLLSIYVLTHTYNEFFCHRRDMPLIRHESVDTIEGRNIYILCVYIPHKHVVNVF